MEKYQRKFLIEKNKTHGTIARTLSIRLQKLSTTDDCYSFAYFSFFCRFICLFNKSNWNRFYRHLTTTKRLYLLVPDERRKSFHVIIDKTVACLFFF